MRKTIGIPMINQGENSVGLTKAYLEYFRDYGQIILLAPDAFIDNLDLLVLPGGKDVAHGNPDEYSFYSSDNERFLEYFDKFTLPQYIENATPIYGICRGFQTLLRHYGIPLLPHIWWDHGYSEKETDTKVNELTYEKYQEFGRGERAVKTVGSWHHQGVTLDVMREQDVFDVVAYTKHKSNREDLAIVEFIEHKTLPIIAEQSHPERNGNRFETALINKLLAREKELV